MQIGRSTVRSHVYQVEATTNPFNAIPPIRHANISILKRTERQLQFAHILVHVVDRARYLKKMHHNFIVGLGHVVRVSWRRLQGDQDQIEL